MTRRRIEALYVGTIVGLMVTPWVLPAVAQQEVVRWLYLALLGPMAAVGAALQWTVGALVWDLMPDGPGRGWVVLAVYVLVTMGCALANVGLVRLLTRAVRAVRGRVERRVPRATT